jgi:hypothetical protein
MLRPKSLVTSGTIASRVKYAVAWQRGHTPGAFVDVGGPTTPVLMGHP